MISLCIVKHNGEEKTLIRTKMVRKHDKNESRRQRNGSKP